MNTREEKNQPKRIQNMKRKKAHTAAPKTRQPRKKQQEKEEERTVKANMIL